jgi:hypothetical protein
LSSFVNHKQMEPYLPKYTKNGWTKTTLGWQYRKHVKPEVSFEKLRHSDKIPYDSKYKFSVVPLGFVYLDITCLACALIVDDGVGPNKTRGVYIGLTWNSPRQTHQLRATLHTRLRTRGPVHFKHSHWWRRWSRSKFASHYAWGTNRVCECKMDVKSIWFNPTWHRIDRVLLLSRCRVLNLT